jgi:hypothetical protein
MSRSNQYVALAAAAAAAAWLALAAAAALAQGAPASEERCIAEPELIGCGRQPEPAHHPVSSANITSLRPWELPCTVRPDPAECSTERVPAHGAVATVPGRSPPIALRQ